VALTILGDKVSGNCLKVLWTARHLDLDHRWRDIDIMKGESRTSEFLALNPAGQVPVLILDDGRALAQSNAIIFYLAEGSSLIPTDAVARARMLEWMFWGVETAGSGSSSASRWGAPPPTRRWPA